MIRQLYIYDWRYYEEEDRSLIRIDYIRQRELDKGYYIFHNYRCFCYFDSRCSKQEIVMNKKLYEIESYEKKLYPSYKNINEERYYWKIIFRSYKKMRLFCDLFPNYRSYMNHCDPLKIYMFNNNYSFTGWYNVDILEEKEDIISISRCDFVDIPIPKIASFDIECISDHGDRLPKSYIRKDNIFMISLIIQSDLQQTIYLFYLSQDRIYGKENWILMRYENEIDMIDGMLLVLKLEDPDVIIGYNISGFDFPYIIDRYKLHMKNILDISRHGTTISITGKDIYQSTIHYISSTGRVIIDLFFYFKKIYPLWVSHKLKDVCALYLNEGKIEMNHSEGWKKLKSCNEETRISTLKEFAIYCIRDSLLTLSLFEKFQVWIDRCEFANISVLSIENTINRGSFHISENSIIRACIERNIVLDLFYNDSTKEKIKGGHVLEPVCGVYRNGVAVLDFKSLYPSIFIAYNICMSTKTISSNVDPIYKNYRFSLKKIGILPNILDSLRKYRIEIQKMAKNETDKFKKTILQYRQNAIKIMSNAMYGTTLIPSKYFPDSSCGETVTAIGRQQICKLEKTIDLNPNINVIYGDTDSIFFTYIENFFVGKSNEAKKEYALSISNEFNKNMKSPMFLEFDGFFEQMILIQKKQYITFQNGEIKFKGVIGAKRNYCNLARKLFLKLCEMIFINRPYKEIEEYLKDTILKLINGKIDIEDLILTVSVKDLTSYKNDTTPQYRYILRLRDLSTYRISVGDRIPYLIKKGNSKYIGDLYRLPHEIEINDIDTDYYIKHFKSPINILIKTVFKIEDIVSRITTHNKLKVCPIDYYFASQNTSV